MAADPAQEREAQSGEAQGGEALGGKVQGGEAQDGETEGGETEGGEARGLETVTSRVMGGDTAAEMGLEFLVKDDTPSLTHFQSFSGCLNFCPMTTE
jgi:hypothetical protein